MSQIVGFDDIVGMDAGNQYGPSEVAGATIARTLLAKDLPKSVVGIPETSVESGEVEAVTIDVQREFRPDRLMLLDMGGATSAEGDLFRLLTFKIGDTNLNASPNPVPLVAFAESAVGTSIRAPRTTDPSLGIDMEVENANTAGEGAPEWLLAGSVFGPSARPGQGPNGGVAGIVGATQDEASDPGVASNDDAKNLPQSFVGLPYTAGAVAARGRVSLNCKVFRDVRPDRLVVGVASMQDWMIRDLRVGTTSLNASTNPIPSRCFSFLSFGNRLRATVTATPSLGITIDAFSLAIGSATAPLCGAFFGPSRFPST